MASNINANTIDPTFPVAGQDNNSQGFRDNFTNCKNNFSYANSEITDLQNKVILKEALSGGTLNNSLAGAVVSGAQYLDFRETRKVQDATIGAITLSHGDAHYHKIASTTGSVTLTLNGWPAAGQRGRIRLQIIISSVAHTLTLPAAVSLGTEGVQGYAANVITFAAVGTYEFEFTSADAGTTITIFDMSRPKLGNSLANIGYGTGSGGAVTQITSRTTGVTLNKPSGAITLVSAAGSASYQTFTVTNSYVAATDVVVVSQKSGTDKHEIYVTAVAAGSFNITFAAISGTTTEQPVINFVVIKAVIA